MDDITRQTQQTTNSSLNIEAKYDIFNQNCILLYDLNQIKHEHLICNKNIDKVLEYHQELRRQEVIHQPPPLINPVPELPRVGWFLPVSLELFVALVFPPPEGGLRLLLKPVKHLLFIHIKLVRNLGYGNKQ